MTETIEGPPLEDADVETSSRNYASRFDSKTGRFFLDTQSRLTRQALGEARGRSVLDLGGGHGQTAEFLTDLGFDVTVMGSSPAACSESLQVALDRGRVHRFRHGNLREPSVLGSFDIIVSYRLLAHTYDLEALVAGMTLAARQSIVVDYPTTRSFNAVADWFFGAKKRVEVNTRPFRVFRDREIVGVFSRHGFRLTSRAGQFFWPMALHRAVGSRSFSRAIEFVARLLGLNALFGSPVIARFDRETPS